MAETNDDFQSLCTTIGFVVVNWALAEQSLDFTVETIYKECAGSTIQKSCPFTHKVEFLKKALRTRAALQVYAEDGIKLLDRMVTMSQKNGTIRCMASS
jgi:hypothetical protein